MATKKAGKAPGKTGGTLSKIDEAEAKVNFRMGLDIMKDSGDKAGLAKAKKEHPDLYAAWENGSKKPGKTGKK